MRRALSGLLTAITGAAGAVDASAAPAAQQWSFHGHCTFAGDVRFTPPLTSSPQPGRGTATATGTCSGTLTATGRTARQLKDVRSRYWATDSSAQMDCQGGQAPGNGWLRIGHVRLAFRLVETRAAAAALLQFSSPTWSGNGTAHTDASADPVEQVQACATSGLRSSPLDITVHA